VFRSFSQSEPSIIGVFGAAGFLFLVILFVVCRLAGWQRYESDAFNVPFVFGVVLSRAFRCTFFPVGFSLLTLPFQGMQH